MNPTLHVIADTSGSMKEMGKIHLQRNLCRYANQLKTLNLVFSNLNMLFFQWNAEVARIRPDDDGDIPPLAARGPSDLGALAAFLRETRDEGRTLRALVLSDGNFSSEADWSKELGNPPGWRLRTVAVGADADLLRLREIASNGRCYQAEDIATAVNDAAFGPDGPVREPASADQIISPAEAGGGRKA